MSRDGFLKSVLFQRILDLQQEEEAYLRGVPVGGRKTLSLGMWMLEVTVNRVSISALRSLWEVWRLDYRRGSSWLRVGDGVLGPANHSAVFWVSHDFL